MTVEIVAIATSAALAGALLWIWVPYLTRRPQPQHARRQVWNFPHRLPLPPEKPARPAVPRVGGRLPETWEQFKREHGIR